MTPVAPESTALQVSTSKCKYMLRMARSLGDVYLKQSCDDAGTLLSPVEQALTALPDVTVRRRSDGSVP